MHTKAWDSEVEPATKAAFNALLDELRKREVELVMSRDDQALRGIGGCVLRPVHRALGRHQLVRDAVALRAIRREERRPAREAPAHRASRAAAR